MNFAGLDIGGANVKFASTSGKKREVSFPFWKEKDNFPKVLSELCNLIEKDDLVGVTMTAELADCFESKQSGVQFIVDTVCKVLQDSNFKKPLFYRTDGTMCDRDTATKDWPLIAASNWHALAWLAFLESNQDSGFVFDIGSTTTDIIPVCDGEPAIPAQNDLDRLTNGQLYYGGVGRTPICGLLDFVDLDGRAINLAQEFFATTNDAFIFLNEIPEDKDCFDTADGKSKSCKDVERRLLRMVCADAAELGDRSSEIACEIALQAKRSLTNGIAKSLYTVLNENKDLPLNFVGFGAGTWLAEKIVAKEFVAFADRLTFRHFSADRLTNQTAPAFAVAKKRQQIFLRTGK